MISIPSAQEAFHPHVSKYLTTTESGKISALIYGAPITGKTTGARTFPKPVMVDFDGNLPPGTPNVIPMWSDKFVDNIIPRGNPKWPANRRDALLIVYADLARELPAGYTIITDSLTRIETWFNAQEDVEPPPLSKEGKVDGHAMWRKRLGYFDKLFTILTACPAHVVFIAHQQYDRDEKGNITSAIRPALMGQIGEKLPGYFPVVLQAERIQNPKTQTMEYNWRTQPTVMAPARVPKPCPFPSIPQQFSELIKYI